MRSPGATDPPAEEDLTTVGAIGANTGGWEGGCHRKRNGWFLTSPVSISTSVAAPQEPPFHAAYERSDDESWTASMISSPLARPVRVIELGAFIGSGPACSAPQDPFQVR